MKWTKRHSQNAVRAKARKRMAEPDLAHEVQRKIRYRRARAKWRIRIDDIEHGDSLELTLYKLPWPARYVGKDRREYSAAKVGRIIALLLSEAP